MDNERKLLENINYFKCLKRMTGTIQADIKKEYSEKKHFGFINKLKKEILLEFVDRLYKSAVNLQHTETEKLQSLSSKKKSSESSLINDVNNKYKKMKYGLFSKPRS